MGDDDKAGSVLERAGGIEPIVFDKKVLETRPLGRKGGKRQIEGSL
jgi:hypothetical protein